MRFAAIEFMKTRGPADPAKIKEMENEPTMKKLKEIDSANRAWLNGVVEKRGWPGKNLVGDDGAHKSLVAGPTLRRRPRLSEKMP